MLSWEIPSTPPAPFRIRHKDPSVRHVLRYCLFTFSALALPHLQAQGDPCDVQATPLKALTATVECSQCKEHALPGAIEPSTHSVYMLHSDLPEMFDTNGVLYTTRTVLPPFELKDGTTLTEEMRTQVNRGFTSIDDDFEVFLFHISQPGDGTAPRRLVIHVQNMGADPVLITPRQVIITDGTIGTVHEMESTLGRRVLEEQWDRPLESVTIAPGAGEVVAYSKQFSAMANGPDSSSNVNCFGIVRAEVKSKGETPANLEVSVVAIDGTPALTTLGKLAATQLQAGARSQEGYFDFKTEPTGCQLRRAAGVVRDFAFRSELLTVDVDSLVSESLKFQMAVPAVQSQECPEARQTSDFILSPKYNRPDTVGNYMMEYFVRFHVVNRNSTLARSFDLRFGKNDADIGLGWEVLRGSAPGSDDQLKARPTRTGWAGPKQAADLPDNTRSFLADDGGPILLGPCEEEYVVVRFMILGNSSLPFQLHLVGEDVSGASGN